MEVQVDLISDIALENLSSSFPVGVKSSFL